MLTWSELPSTTPRCLLAAKNTMNVEYLVVSSSWLRVARPHLCVWFHCPIHPYTLNAAESTHVRAALPFQVNVGREADKPVLVVLWQIRRAADQGGW